MMKNIDKKTVKDFGEEWNKYNQSDLSYEQLEKALKVIQELQA